MSEELPPNADVNSVTKCMNAATQTPASSISSFTPGDLICVVTSDGRVALLKVGGYNAGASSLAISEEKLWSAPSPGPPPTSNPIFNGVALAVPDFFYVNLDPDPSGPKVTGSEESGQSDLYASNSGGYIEPDGDTSGVSMSEGLPPNADVNSPKKCMDAATQTPASSISSFTPGDLICVTTSDGNIALLKAGGYNQNLSSLILTEFRLWKSPSS